MLAEAVGGEHVGYLLDARAHIRWRPTTTLGRQPVGARFVELPAAALYASARAARRGTPTLTSLLSTSRISTKRRLNRTILNSASSRQRPCAISLTAIACSESMV